jgi:hypothetical protein
MAEHEGQEIDNTVVEGEEEGIIASQETDTEEVELDDDGNPVANADDVEVVVEAWQNTEEDESELPDVPVNKHIAMKQKLKGRIKDRDDELDRIKQELEQLKSTGGTPTELPPRPKAEDFDTDEEYHEARDKWDDDRLELKLRVNQDKTKEAEALNNHKRAVAKAVDAHYDRTAALVADKGMKPEYFKEADTAVRESVEAILPRKGDGVTDHIISLLGEGSEKVMYFIGRNKAARLEFQSLLSEDKTGSKALVYLGMQKQRLTNPAKPTSSAPKPAATVNGDANVSQQASALKKKYDSAHKGNKTQVAYNIKKEAKAAGVDVSQW